MRFHKYQAVGNDYVVLEPADFPSWKEPSQAHIRAICHRNFGVGSDGILWGPLATTKADFGLRIFNPDGSEAEKSGNGLRIFSRFLWDRGLVRSAPFTVDTQGGSVRCTVGEDGAQVTVAMGSVSFDSRRIPVAGPAREVIRERMEVGGQALEFTAATIGNPHCVILTEGLSPELARRYGPDIEVHPNFPNRTNVQFMRVIDRSTIQIEIWERGAGYTLASGSSSSAAAAVAHRLGLVDRSVTVNMPGGSISIEIGDGFSITMKGPVGRIADGELHPDLLAGRPVATAVST
jgi:diaminopimelate epimerase